MHFDWGSAAVVGVFLAGWYLDNRRVQKKRHEQNLSMLGVIKTDLDYNPPHIHIEETGPLTAEGIRFRRRSTDR